MLRPSTSISGKALLRVLLVALLLSGFVVMLHHAAHCDHPGSDCSICSLLGSIVVIAAVGLIVICSPAKPIRHHLSRAHVQTTGLPHRPVRAPPSIHFPS